MNKNAAQYRALLNGGAFDQRRARTELTFSCGFVWANENNGAISALSGVAVAFFTFTLWIATKKLWESAEVERAANERSSEDSRGQTRQSLAIAKQAADASARTADAITEQRDLMRGQHDIMASQREISLASQRAWLRAVVKVAGPIKVAEDYVSGSFTLELMNTGMLPAYICRPCKAALPWDINPETSQNPRISHIINHYKTDALPRHGVIFPQQSIDEPFLIELRKSDIDIAQNTSTGFVPVLRGAIQYDYPGSTQRHFTTFHVHIVKIPDPTASSAWHPIPTGNVTTIPASDLIVNSQLGEAEAT